LLLLLLRLRLLLLRRWLLLLLQRLLLGCVFPNGSPTECIERLGPEIGSR